MSRFTITVNHGHYRDESGAIGFEPPWRTFVLQGFTDRQKETGTVSVQLRTVLEECPTLKSLTKRLELAGHRHEPVSGMSWLCHLGEAHERK